LRIIEETAVREIERLVTRAVGPHLAPVFRGPALLEGVREALALDRRSIEIELPLDHLDAIARQPDHAFDIVDRCVPRVAVHRDIAVARWRAEDPAGK
jgi:hypothetical protein